MYKKISFLSVFLDSEMVVYSNQIICLMCIFFKLPTPCRMLSPFRGGRIEYLNDLDSYADWSFYTPVSASQVRQVEG